MVQHVCWSPPEAVNVGFVYLRSWRQEVVLSQIVWSMSKSDASKWQEVEVLRPSTRIRSRDRSFACHPTLVMRPPSLPAVAYSIRRSSTNQKREATTSDFRFLAATNLIIRIAKGQAQERCNNAGRYCGSLSEASRCVMSDSRSLLCYAAVECCARSSGRELMRF